MHLRKITNYEKLKNKTKRLWNWSLVIERSQIFAENLLGGGGGGGVGEAWWGLGFYNTILVWGWCELLKMARKISH